MTQINENETGKFLSNSQENKHEKDKYNKSNKRLLYSFSCVAIFVVITFGTIVLRKSEDSNYTPVTSALTQSSQLIPPNPETRLPPSYTHLHIYPNGAVCSDSQICSEIGRDVLARNGSAIDSAIATSFCNGLTNMQSMGIGGGFIMNIYVRKEKKSYTLDAREITAGAAFQEMHLHDPRTTNEGPLSIGIPGELKGYWEAYKRFGTLPWAELVEPAIRLCEAGFVMTKHMSDSTLINPIIRNDEQLRDMFVDPETGEFKKHGSIIKPKKLCQTLRKIAERGGNDMYHGELADELAEDLKDVKSLVTKEDLQTYKVRWSESVPIDINGDTMYITPPPASGILLGFIMNILKGYNFTPKDMDGVNNTILTYHRIIEAYKFAYGKRTEIGDPKFINIDELVRNLTSPSYAESIRQMIDDKTTKTNPEEYGAQYKTVDNNGTAHISILAPNGDAVSITSSVNFYFGAGLTGNRTGIILNSGMDDFSSPGLKNYFGLPGAKPNFIKPHKRALNSMSPTIIVDSNHDVKLVIGAAGGTKITTAVSMAIMQYLWFDQDIKQAVDFSRFHHQLIPMEIQYEYGNLDGVIKGLEAIGHKTRRYKERGSIICGITRNATGVYANSDYRKGGDVAGL